MIITIGERTEQMMSIMGINAYPFTSGELKKAFRTKAKELHPDKNNGDDSEFKEMSKAYSQLINLAVDSGHTTSFAQMEKEISSDVFNMWEPCVYCNESGSIPRKRIVKVPCPRCNKKGWPVKFRPTSRCRACDKGKYTKKNGEVVDCFVCHGTGVYGLCPVCKNEMFIEKEKTEYKQCLVCRGLGKIKNNPFNPVIRKGAVLSTV